MIAFDAFIHQESISLYKKLLADRITDGQREVIGKMLAEEEAKLLDLKTGTTSWALPPNHFLR
jgi:hypothetical protein